MTFPITGPGSRPEQHGFGGAFHFNVLIRAATNQDGLFDHVGQSVIAHSGKPLTAA